jgi:hypothetical protein
VPLLLPFYSEAKERGSTTAAAEKKATDNKVLQRPLTPFGALYAVDAVPCPGGHIFDNSTALVEAVALLLSRLLSAYCLGDPGWAWHQLLEVRRHCSTACMYRSTYAQSTGFRHTNTLILDNAVITLHCTHTHNTRNHTHTQTHMTQYNSVTPHRISHLTGTYQSDWQACSTCQACS